VAINSQDPTKQGQTSDIEIGNPFLHINAYILSRGRDEIVQETYTPSTDLLLLNHMGFALFKLPFMVIPPVFIETRVLHSLYLHRPITG
jgi:hypothetical protein